MAELEIPIEAYACLDYMPRGFHKAVRITIAAELRRIAGEIHGTILATFLFDRADELDPPCGS